MEKQNEALSVQQGIVNDLEVAAKSYQDRLIEIEHIIENMNWNFIIGWQALIIASGADLDAASQALENLKNNPPPAQVFPPSPKMDTGGLVQGPGTFRVGPGVVEVLRRYDSGKSSGGGKTITQNFNISQLVVREEADVTRIARELYRMQQTRI